MCITLFLFLCCIYYKELDIILLNYVNFSKILPAEICSTSNLNSPALLCMLLFHAKKTQIWLNYIQFPSFSRSRCHYVHGSPIGDKEISQTAFVLKGPRFLTSLQTLLSCPRPTLQPINKSSVPWVFSEATCFVWQASAARLHPIVSGFEVRSREHAEVNLPWWCKYQHGQLVMSEAATQLSIQAFNQRKWAQSGAVPELNMKTETCPKDQPTQWLSLISHQSALKLLVICHISTWYLTVIIKS